MNPTRKEDALGVVGFLVMLAWIFAEFLLPESESKTIFLFVWLIAATTGLIIGLLAIRREERRKKVIFSRRFCRHCSYNLTGNVSGACPECGEKVRS
jgi:peptidoglycan/LPS O-acetylase OafA/YrhL